MDEKGSWRNKDTTSIAIFFQDNESAIKMEKMEETQQVIDPDISV